MMAKTTIVAFLLIFAVARARDWSKIKTFGPSPSGPGSRIIGGQEATPYQFPYQIALFINATDGNEYFCGGSLITENYVMTAAHCGDIAIVIVVIAGAYDLSLDDEPNRQTFISVDITVHPQWSSSLIRNDIAVIKLPEPAVINLYVQLITLPPQNDGSHAGELATVSGWGKIADAASSISPVLKYVTVPVISNAQCLLSYLLYITPKIICTSGANHQNTCNGDSGGPLVINTKQVGIVSFGKTTCESGSPAAYTRVSSYVSWISANTDIGTS